MKSDPSILKDVCASLTDDRHGEARRLLESEYPFEAIEPVNRTYTEYQRTQVFVRDGFIDRYTGNRLVFPGALRLISEALPEAFPYHPNGKMSECHRAYWELLPTIDHVVPVSRGGEDSTDNWVTTSMRRNGIKANWTMEELGWSLVEPGELSEWDGLIGWFLQEVEEKDELLNDSKYLRRWYRAAQKHAV